MLTRSVAGACECEGGWIVSVDTGACSTSVCQGSQQFCLNGGECSEDSDVCECAPWYDYNTHDPQQDANCEHCTSHAPTSFMTSPVLRHVTHLFLDNYCHGETCSAHGTCINQDASFHCECDSGFWGERCENQFCINGLRCRNGGACRFVSLLSLLIIT